MKKIALGALLILVITIGFSVYYLLSNLDNIVKTAIETYGTEATQTSVKVGSVKIVLKDGSGAIRNLAVGNPSGFATAQAFSMGEIATQIDLKSLSEEVPVIAQITVRAPEVFYELNNAGKNNLSALKQNLTGSGTSSPAPKKGGTSEPRLIIRKLVFADGSIHAKVVPLGKDYELKLPDIQLNNLGGTNGATPSQIAEQVISVFTERALQEIKKKGLDQYKAQLEGEVKKRLEAEKGKLNEELQDKLKGVLSY